jgi:hypothetical protein
VAHRDVSHLGEIRVVPLGEMRVKFASIGFYCLSENFNVWGE